MIFTGKRLSKNLSDMKSTDIGKLGEDAAVRYLCRRGYKIKERNYRTKFGEIDIIAQDGEYTCFVEVRLRKKCGYALPAETIDKRKQEKLIKCAQHYIVKHNLSDSALRFDAVLIEGDAAGKEKLCIEVIKDAFRN